MSLKPNAPENPPHSSGPSPLQARISLALATLAGLAGGFVTSDPQTGAEVFLAVLATLRPAGGGSD